MKLYIQGNCIFIVLISGLLLWNRVDSIRFDLELGHTKCITEDIKSNSMTVGKYHVVNPDEGHPLPDTHKITVRVTSPHGNSYHFSDHVVEGQFTFQAVEGGDYMTCFFSNGHKSSTSMTIDFDWKSGVAARDWTNIAKKGSVELMELELKKMFDVVQSIHEEMFYLREREEEMQELNISTNSKMAWLSVVSILVCSIVAALQLWHLKSFFEKKKLI